MRLIDIVMQSPKTQVCHVGTTSRVMPAAGTLARSIDKCSLRYVLDRAASAQVSRLVFTPRGPLANPDDLTRLPDRPFWLECFLDDGTNGAGGQRSPGRLGFYVEPAGDGFGAVIDCVYENNLGEAGILAARVEIDLMQSPVGPRMHRMRHADNLEIDRLLEKARLAVGEDWHLLARQAPERYKDIVAWQAERAWVAVPLLLAFAALLNSRSALVQRPSSLAKLNRTRMRSNRPALLDHVEVSLNLTPSDRHDVRGPSGGDVRHSPCLHYVRGQHVTRAGRTFWRNSHFRGDGIIEQTRTVRVTAGGGRTQQSRVN